MVIAIGAPWIAPPPENARDPYMIPRDGFSTTPQAPSEQHPLGTTEGQYDIYYGVIWGTRTAFRIGVVITIVHDHHRPDHRFVLRASMAAGSTKC